MKKVLFRRKALFRALRAAAFAFLCWIGAQRAAQAQAFSNPPFTGSGTTYGVTSTTPVSGNYGFYDPSTSYNLTLGRGASVTNTSASGYGSASGSYASPYAAVTLGGGSVVNRGTLAMNTSGSSGDFYAALSLAGTGSGYVHNYGTLSASAGAGLGSGLYFLSGGAAGLTVVNENGAAISGSGAYGFGINSQAAAGATLITNNSGGTISGNAAGIEALSGAGAITLHNSGTIRGDSTASSASGVYGVYGVSAATFSGGAITIVNNKGGIIEGTSPSSSAYGIQASTSAGGDIAITNNGAVSAILNATGTSPGVALGIDADSDGALTIANGGAITASNTSHTNSGSAYGIRASATGLLSVTNNGTITASDATTASAYGIAARSTSGSDVFVTNNGAINATVADPSGGSASGITASSAGALTVANGGNITARNTSHSVYGDSAYGISATATGALSVTNNGIITASNANLNPGTPDPISAYGIRALSTSGSGVSVTNNGSIRVDSVSGYGIHASSTGALSVINHGTITLASESGYGIGYGIELGSVGTVYNTGTINTLGGSGNAIRVPDGGTVTLAGAGVVSGLITGGDTGIGSTLNFNLTVRSNYNATVAALDADIANGAYRVGLDSVRINGHFYNFDLFQTVTDGLIKGIAFAQAPGYASMGGTLDALGGSTDPHALALLSALGTVTDADLPAVLGQLSASKVSQQLLAQPVSQAVFQNLQLDSRLTQVRSGFAGGIDVDDFQLASATQDPLLSQVQGRLYAYNPAPASTRSDTPDSLSSNQQFARWGTFLSGNAVLANQNATATQNRVDSTTVDLTAGADYRLDKNWAVGFLFGYGRTVADVDGFGSRVKGDQYRFGPYAGYNDGPWYANASGYFAVNRESSDRVIAFLGQSAHSNPDGTQYGFNADGGYDFKAGHLTYGPTGGLQYTHLDVNAYTESGSDADLNVAGQRSDSLLCSLGAKADYDLHWNWNNSTVRPEVRASWLHEFEGGNRPINAAFDIPGSAGFTLAAAHQERESALLGGGVQNIFKGGSLLFLDYDAQVQDNYLAQSITGGFKIVF